MGQVRDAGGLASGGGGEDWMDSGYSLMIQPTGSTDKLDVE